MALCERCLHNSFGMDCIKDRMTYPRAGVCNDYVNKANASNVALLQQKPLYVPPPAPVKKTTWEIFSSTEPTKCIFYAYVP